MGLKLANLEKEYGTRLICGFYKKLWLSIQARLSFPPISARERIELYLFRKQSNGIYGLSHVYDHKEMLFKINLYFKVKVKSQKIRLLRILMMLVRFLWLKDRTSEEVASEKLNSAEESLKDFIEDVHDSGNYAAPKDLDEDVHNFGNYSAPKDLNNAGEDLKDVAVHALKNLGEASKEDVAVNVKNLIDGERVLVESAIRNPKIKEA